MHRSLNWPHQPIEQGCDVLRQIRFSVCVCLVSWVFGELRHLGRPFSSATQANRTTAFADASLACVI